MSVKLPLQSLIYPLVLTWNIDCVDRYPICKKTYRKIKNPKVKGKGTDVLLMNPNPVTEI